MNNLPNENLKINNEKLLCHAELVSASNNQTLKRVQGDVFYCAKHRKNSQFSKRAAFTLAEVLITLGVLGVVAAITLPTLLTNVQQRVQKEQLRSAKYKLTLSTDKMKSLGLLENQSSNT